MLSWLRLGACARCAACLQSVRRASRKAGEPLDNPLEYLSSFSKVPLLDEKTHLFRPSTEEVKAAQQYFKERAPGDIRPWRGAIDVDRLPETLTPEVAFIGRSNVGKSSLIKSLFFNAHFRIDISKTAGRTRTIQVYEVGAHLSLVDMPGYGENMPEYYADCVEKYLTQRKNLTRTFLLLDGAAGITEEDQIGLDMMEEFGVPYALVLTKLDMLTPGEQLRQVYAINNHMRAHLRNTCFPQPFVVSAHAHSGMAYLRAFIASITNCRASLSTTPRKRRLFT